MKKIFLAGSRKFADELENIFKLCKKAGIEVIKGRDNADALSNEEEKKASQFVNFDFNKYLNEELDKAFNF